MTILSINKTTGETRSFFCRHPLFYCVRLLPSRQMILRVEIIKMKIQNDRTVSRSTCRDKIKRSITELRLLIKSVPTVIFALFVIAVFCMNLMANKSIALPFDWLALDCGLVVSWFVFLVLDVMTKHFGPKAATQLSIFATLLNLVLCFVFFIVSIIPGTWGESYVEGSEAVINAALNNTFGGTWYIIFGSTVAFLISSFANNCLNAFVGKAFKKNPDGMAAYLIRSYVSTAAAQFTDNFVFSLLVSRAFFGWSLTQCVTCALLGMVAELISEMLFSLFGYRICEGWRKNKIGEEYLCYIHGTERTEI